MSWLTDGNNHTRQDKWISFQEYSVYTESYVQESPDPRLLYSGVGNSLTASVYFNSASVQVTQKAVGQSTPIRIVIGSYAVGYVGNNTTVRLKQLI